MTDIILTIIMVIAVICFFGFVYEVIDFFLKSPCSCDDNVDFLFIENIEGEKKFIRIDDINEITFTDEMTVISMKYGVVHTTKLTLEEIDRVIDYYDPTVKK